MRSSTSKTPDNKVVGTKAPPFVNDHVGNVAANGAVDKKFPLRFSRDKTDESNLISPKNLKGKEPTCNFCTGVKPSVKKKRDSTLKYASACLFVTGWWICLPIPLFLMCFQKRKKHYTCSACERKLGVIRNGKYYSYYKWILEFNDWWLKYYDDNFWTILFDLTFLE